MEIVRVAALVMAGAAMAAGPASAAGRTGAAAAEHVALVAPDAARAELAPNGTMRVALVEAPKAGVFFVRGGPDGTPHGVTADLAADLARVLGAHVVFKVFPNSGDATEATRKGEVELSFMPVDEARRALVAFGPGYYDIESTYLVTGASGIVDVKEVDRPGLRVLAITGTTTFRASARTLTKTQPVAVPSVAEALAAMRDGRADAFALTRDTLGPMMSEVPGSRIVTGGFQRTSVSVAVPKPHAAALAFASAWLDGAKRDGTVQRIFAEQGLSGETVSE